MKKHTKDYKNKVVVPSDNVGCLVAHNITEPILGSENGPLVGKTLIIKDLYDISGRKTGNGSPDFLDKAKPAKTTAKAVERLLEAGADIVGISICDEFFYSLTGANAHYGTPKNLRAIGRLPGGSSSGSAAALAAELCDISLGSDTGGSVRIPASFCGLYGIRPTHGRVDLAGGRPMAPSFDTAGWFANDAHLFRTVGSVLLDKRISGGEVNKVLVAEDCFSKTDPEVSKTLKSFLKNASDFLPIRLDIKIASGELDKWSDAFKIIQAYEVRNTNLPWVEKNKPNLGPGIKERFKMAANISLEEFSAAKNVRENVQKNLRELISPGTIVCLPTAPVIAPEVNSTLDQLEFFRANTLLLTCISGLSGLPQVTIPAENMRNCPIGLSFIGWEGGDEALLDLAMVLSSLCQR